MIEIEHRGNLNGNDVIYKYRVTCTKCDTTFTFDTTDLVKTELSDTRKDIICPVCKRVVFFSHAERIGKIENERN